MSDWLWHRCSNMVSMEYPFEFCLHGNGAYGGWDSSVFRSDGSYEVALLLQTAR